jgi:hypothetical protein
VTAAVAATAASPAAVAAAAGGLLDGMQATPVHPELHTPQDLLHPQIQGEHRHLHRLHQPRSCHYMAQKSHPAACHCGAAAAGPWPDELQLLLLLLLLLLD